VGRSALAANTAWNLVGALLPVPVIVLCIPPLIAALGVERFGVLGLAWMVLGYFGMFDFGLAQSTTRFVSAGMAQGQHGSLRPLVLGSALLHAALGLAGAAIFALLVPWLLTMFKLPAELVPETRAALYLLAASVPAMVLTAALRGAVEGLQRFDVVNLIRVPASIVNYAGPLLALAFGDGLPLVVGVIVVARYVVLVAYSVAVARLVPAATPGAGVTGAQLVTLASYGGWLTATNFLNPIVIAADRFVIGAAVSVAAVAFYVTPYEVITKGWILSASLMGAMFPMFAALAASDPGAIRGACRSAQRYLLALAAPFIVLIVGAADLLLGWWLGEDFSANSSRVAQLLALGMLVNIVAQVPLTALNAVGRADVSAKIAVCELPLYIPSIWWAATHFGVEGVAAVWAARAALDAIALFIAAHAVLPGNARLAVRAPGAIAIVGIFVGAAWMAPVLVASTSARLGVLASLLTVMVVWEWRLLLASDERANLRQLCSRLLTSPAR
jgi:O-antigen/teichoic acid export membrane protein